MAPMSYLWYSLTIHGPYVIPVVQSHHSWPLCHTCGTVSQSMAPMSYLWYSLTIHGPYVIPVVQSHHSWPLCHTCGTVSPSNGPTYLPTYLATYLPSYLPTYLWCFTFKHSTSCKTLKPSGASVIFLIKLLKKGD